MTPMPARLLILSLVFAVSAGYAARATRAEETPIRVPLAELPMRIADWHGRDDGRFLPTVERVLGVDEYVNRSYVRAADAPLYLYVGYYQSQRQGDTIHSPLNCLPGAGWQPVAAGRVDVPLGGSAGSIHVNRYIVEKGLDRQVVVYWYQSHGRVIASEYWSRAFMAYDAIRLNRTDAALVRVTTPLLANEDVDTAGARAAEFVRQLFPLLAIHLPS